MVVVSGEGNEAWQQYVFVFGPVNNFASCVVWAWYIHPGNRELILAAQTRGVT